jgi:predicted metal-dependent phosphoesterase TrpH
MKRAIRANRQVNIFPLRTSSLREGSLSHISRVNSAPRPEGRRITSGVKSQRPLKVDLHLHTADDPLDRISYSAKDIIVRAADEEFDVISITNHDRLTFNQDLYDFAREMGILLIPGIEATLENRHVLVLNPPRNKTFSDFSSLSKALRPETLVIAPHPYFPGAFSLNGCFKENFGLFDAIEYCHFYTPRINFNLRALEFSRSNGFPLIGNSDTHFLFQFGTTYSMIYAEKNIESVFAAIRENKVEVVTRPLSPREMGWIARRFLRMKLRGKPTRSRRRSVSRIRPVEDSAIKQNSQTPLLVG